MRKSHLAYKIILTICVLIAALSLTACEGPDTASFESAIGARLKANEALIDNLQQAGIIDKGLSKDLKKCLDTAKQELTLGKKDTVSQRAMQCIASWWDVNYDTYGKKEIAGIYPSATDQKTWAQTIYTEAIRYGAPDVYSSLPTEPKKINPYDIFSTYTQNLNDALSGQIYTLNVDALYTLIGENTTGDVSIDQVTKYMKLMQEISSGLVTGASNYKASDGKEYSTEDLKDMLTTVFTPVSKNGEPVYWIDASSSDYAIIQYDSYNGGTVELDDASTVVHGFTGNENGVPLGWDGGGGPGFDLPIFQTPDGTTGTSGKGIPVMTLRLRELNEDAVANVIKAYQKLDDKYIRVPGDSGMYLMEYPVKVLDALIDNGSTYKMSYKQSDLNINFKTGSIIKKVNGEEISTNSVEQYMKLGTGAETTDNTDRDYSSFVLLKGENVEQEFQSDMQSNGTTTTITTEIPCLVLRDYLEATYSPKILSNEDLLIYGRMIRFNIHPSSKAVDKKNIAARYINSKTKPLPKGQAPDLYIHNFSDIPSLLKPETITIDTVDYTGKLSRSIPAWSEKLGGPNQGTSNAKSITELPSERVGSISATHPFPSAEIGSIDNTTAEHPLMYTVATNLDMSSSGLIGSWIVGGDKAGGFPWWGAWLKSHNYRYNIPYDDIKKWVSTEYNIVLNDDAFIAYDLDTIKKINKDIVSNKESKSATFIRTAFMLLGILLELYVGLLFGAWAFDTNIGLGINVLEKLSLGHWTAVKYEDDAIVGNREKLQPVTLQSLVVKILILGAIGAALISLDTIKLIVAIINLFGGLGKAVLEMFGNAFS